MNRPDLQLDYTRSLAFWRKRASHSETGLRATALNDGVPAFVTEWTSSRMFARRMRALRAYGPFERALDLGCGDGRWSLALSEIADQVIAVDFCEDFVAATRERVVNCVRNNVVTMVQDARELHVPLRCDLVVMGAVTMYFDDADLDRLIERLATEVVKPGGLVYLRATTHARGKRLRGDYQAIYRSVEAYRKMFEARRFVTLEQRLVHEYSHGDLLTAYYKIARVATLGAMGRWPALQRALFHLARWSSPLTLHGVFALVRCFGTRVLPLRSHELVFVNRGDAAVPAAREPLALPEAVTDG